MTSFATSGGSSTRWYLFGARAAFIRGARRMTADVDVTVLPRQRGSHELVDELTGDFVLRVPDQDGFVARTRVIPLVHQATGMPVDLVLGGPGLEEQSIYWDRSGYCMVAKRLVRGTFFLPPANEHGVVELEASELALAPTRPIPPTGPTRARARSGSARSERACRRPATDRSRLDPPGSAALEIHCGPMALA